MRNETSSPQQHYTAEENAALLSALRELRKRMSIERGGKKVGDGALGRRIGVSAAGIKKYERGGGFSRAAAHKIAECLGKTANSIIAGPEQVYVYDYESTRDPDLRAVLDYFRSRDHNWSEGALAAAIGISKSGGKHTRADWERILTELTAVLAQYVESQHE